MITFDKMLVCVDLSSEGQQIIEKACTIAKRAGTQEVCFLYVVKDFVVPDALQKEVPDIMDRAIQSRKDEMDSYIGELFKCEDIATKMLIKQGNLTKEILHTADEEAIDLIVMGRNEDSDSIINTRIARRASCNLLIIPRKCDLNFDRILVPVDFSDYSELSLNTALSLTNETEAEILLQNVFSVPSSYRYSGKTYEEFAQILKEHSEKDLQNLIRMVEVSTQKLKPIHSIEKNVIEVVHTEAQAQKADLVVMGAKGRTAASALFIGSKAERMIQVNNDVPTLVVRKKGSNAGFFESLQDI